MLRRLYAALFVAFLSLSAIHPLCAQTAAAPAPAATDFSGEPFTSTAEQLKAASAAMPPSHEFDAQILLDEGIYRISPQGTLFYQSHLVYRVDSANGVKNWSEISMTWEPWCEKPALLRARVLQPDDNETFSSLHVRRAPIPAVAIGSIVEQVISTQELSPYFSGGALYRYSFSNHVPAGRKRLVVELPSSLPYRDELPALPGLTVDRSETDGVRRIVYQALSVPATHDSDIDLETNTPIYQIVRFATGASWAAVASTYAALSEPQTIVAEAQSILPADLPADRLPRIRAIVARLHHEVRYTGVEFGSARVTPQSPAEVIKRHYGDCKDKATLLVAMLRAAGIPANLALFSTGPGYDIPSDLPGFNRFNHAIVYVPAAGKDPALWIDATAEYFAVGSLPNMDQGRKALIVSPQTTALTLIPEARPADSVLVETRTYTLSEFGPAHVEETSDTTGSFDADFRSSYVSTDTPKVHEQLENYVNNVYLSKKLVSVKHGDANDFEHPFALSLVADDVRRGMSDMTEALVVIFPAATLSSLPKWFSSEPPVIGPDTSADVKHDLDLAQKSRAAAYVIHPYIQEQRHRILIPVGFSLRSLPPDKTTPSAPHRSPSPTPPPSPVSSTSPSASIPAPPTSRSTRRWPCAPPFSS